MLEMKTRFVDFWQALLSNGELGREFGRNGRQHVCEYGSLEVMTDGYTELIEQIYMEKQREPQSIGATWDNCAGQGTHSIEFRLFQGQ